MSLKGTSVLPISTNRRRRACRDHRWRFRLGIHSIRASVLAVSVCGSTRQRIPLACTCCTTIVDDTGLLSKVAKRITRIAENRSIWDGRIGSRTHHANQPNHHPCDRQSNYPLHRILLHCRRYRVCLYLGNRSPAIHLSRSSLFFDLALPRSSSVP